MNKNSFQKQGIRKISRNIVNSCSATQKHPEQKQQYQRKGILIPSFLVIFQILISCYKKEYKNGCNNQKVKQNND